MIREHVAQATATSLDGDEAETQAALLQLVLQSLLKDEPCVLQSDAQIVLALRPYEDIPGSLVATATALCSDPRCEADFRGRPVGLTD